MLHAIYHVIDVCLVSQTGTFLNITLIIFELRGREAVNMVILLHASHFCCPSFYGYSLKTHKFSEQSGFDDNGEGIEGLCSQDARKEKWAGKNSDGSWGRERGQGVGRNSLSISFHPCSSVRATRHYISTECTSERLKQAKPVQTTVDFSSWTVLSIPPK